jgi:hypothetical protein
MVCSVCKNKFIRTKTQFCYMIQKEIMDKGQIVFSEE